MGVYDHPCPKEMMGLIIGPSSSVQGIHVVPGEIGPDFTGETNIIV